MEKEGKAYGFFYCDASKKQIEVELPAIRNSAQTPSQLELTLTEGVDGIKGDNNLVALAQQAKQEGMRYVLEAKYQGATNKATANELGDILNQAYQSPLYQAGEPFSGAVLYEQDGKYLFKE
ncbi:hypothetical protein HY494_00780 [Candidatus Woesearchaeota archaeon]|nr:hypothetical protein [Candidatus Woesearchaeota archaeon]